MMRTWNAELLTNRIDLLRNAEVNRKLKGVTLVWKVGVSIQKENEASLGPETSGEEKRMGRKYPLLIWLWGLGERRELSQWGSARGGAPVENGFIVI